jgi:hypothetical protein
MTTEISTLKPPHSEKRKRVRPVLVRMTKEECAHLIDQADIACKRPQDFIRALVAGCRLKAIPKIPREVFRNISGIGNNIAQMRMKAYNGAPIPAAEFETLKEDIHRMARCFY